MTKLLTALALFTSLQVCASSRLEGGKYLFKYEGGQHYQVVFSKNQVSWLGVKGDELGKSETDLYQSGAIAEDVFFIQWSELDGTFVALTLNLKSKRIISTGTSGKHRWFRRGELEFTPHEEISTRSK